MDAAICVGLSVFLILFLVFVACCFCDIITKLFCPDSTDNESSEGKRLTPDLETYVKHQPTVGNHASPRLRTTLQKRISTGRNYGNISESCFNTPIRLDEQARQDNYLANLTEDINVNNPSPRLSERKMILKSTNDVSSIRFQVSKPRAQSNDVSHIFDPLAIPSTCNDKRHERAQLNIVSSTFDQEALQKSYTQCVLQPSVAIPPKSYVTQQTQSNVVSRTLDPVAFSPTPKSNDNQRVQWQSDVVSRPLDPAALSPKSNNNQRVQRQSNVVSRILDPVSTTPKSNDNPLLRVQSDVVSGIPNRLTTSTMNDPPTVSRKLDHASNYTNLTPGIDRTALQAQSNVHRTSSQKSMPSSGIIRRKKVDNKAGYGNEESNNVETCWKPASYYTTKRRSYNSFRRGKYQRTDLQPHHLESILEFYNEKVKVDIDIKTETQNYINALLKKILRNKANRGRFSHTATDEGSVAVGLKVGKADESDHSVEILVRNNLIELSDEPFKIEYKDDDIDSNFIDEVATPFVNAGKRYFPDENRPLRKDRKPLEIPNGFIAVSVGRNDSSRFQKCCISTRGQSWLLPYPILSEFHHFVGDAVHGLDEVSLNKGCKGPAITLTVYQDGGPNISVDITPKLTLSGETLNVMDVSWPRRDTRKWLTEDKINDIACQPIYLVAKGDKYWKISFANCEYEILNDIDSNGTWRKACLRIVKKKLMQWQSKSTTGFKGLSSYLLKTTLLWLCEILPEDDFWFKEELANRYLNFLQEFANRLRKGIICEYFNLSVNLLENKDSECIDELLEFLDEEISSLE